MPVSFDRLALLQLALGLAALVVLGPDVAVAADLEVERLRERVDDRDADAVQAAGDLVAAALAAELAAGVEHGEHDLGRRSLLLGVLVNRDPAAVVDDGDRLVRVDRDRDVVAVAGERLVDRVVDDLPDQVVQAARPGRADVHARPLADRVEPAQDGDLTGGVFARPAGRRSSAARFPAALVAFATKSSRSRSWRRPRPPSPKTGPCADGSGSLPSSHKDTRTGGRNDRGIRHKIPANERESVSIVIPDRHGPRRR